MRKPSPLLESIVATQSNVRMEPALARRILEQVSGMTARSAYQTVKFQPGLVSAPIARVMEQGLAEAKRRGLHPNDLKIYAWEVQQGDAITRLRRMAHGIADWITTQTILITIEYVVSRRSIEPADADDG